jgi:hypothetical protein
MALVRPVCALALLCLLSVGCFHNSPPRMGQPYDAAVIPGCPSEENGSLSRCQRERAAWAAILWERGLASRFITSGAAVYTPYVEAEVLAAAIAALGVPADRIYLDPHALHTDENMRNAVRIARQLGWQHLTVASHGPQAKGGCGMITGFGMACTALSIEREPTQAKLTSAMSALQAVRVRPSPSFRPLAEREQAREHETGHRRPRSAWLYLKMWARRNAGAETSAPWLPATLPEPAYQRWSDVAYSDSAR